MNQAKILLSLLILFNVHGRLNEFNYYPKDLLNNIDRYAQNKTLKSELHKVIAGIHLTSSGQRDKIVKTCPLKKKCLSHRTDIDYKEARRIIFGNLYLKTTLFGKYYINDKYCETRYDSSDGVGPNKIPDHTKLNCEHTWPQSRFNKEFSKSLQKNDLHHLFPVNSRANSTRGNIIFGEVINGSASKDCTPSQRGQIDYKNSTTTAYSPSESHRGDVARAVFYFSVRYDSKISEEEEYYLRRWHREDPVSNEEIVNNQKIYEIQNTRNPFIDDEQLVQKIKDF